MKIDQSENQFNNISAGGGARSAGHIGTQRSTKRHTFKSVGHSKSSSRRGSSKKGDKSFNIIDFMPLKSKLAVDIILIAASLEQHAKNNPKEDIYDKIKDIKTFKIFCSAISHSFNGINEKVFSYLFLAIILCISREMEFSFKEYGVIEYHDELKKFAKEVSNIVFDELAGLSKEEDTAASAKPLRHKTTKSRHTVVRARRQSGGRNNRYNNTRSKNNNNKYNQTGGWLDLLLLFFADVYARMFPSGNPRFRNVTLMIMFMYFIFSTFSTYNNFRHLFWPDSLFYQDGDGAPDYSSLMDTVSSSLIVGVPQTAHTSVREQLGPLNSLMNGLPRAIADFLGDANLGINVGEAVGVVIGFGLGSGGVDAGALRVREVLNRFMVSPYYVRMVQHINDVATNMARGTSAVVARTRTPSRGETNGLMRAFRSVGDYFGFDIARLDDQLGDILYNTAHAPEISADILANILRNTRTAIRRIGEDFGEMLVTESTRFTTRIYRHSWGIRHALGGMILSGYWLYLYARFTIELRRRAAARGTTGRALSLAHSKGSKKDDKDDDGDDGNRKLLGNGGVADGSRGRLSM